MFVLKERTVGVHIRAQKSADKTLFICSLRSSTTYAAKYVSKAHARGVSVLALLLAAFFESVEVSKMQEYQRNAFPICSRCTHYVMLSLLHRQSF